MRLEFRRVLFRSNDMKNRVLKNELCVDVSPAHVYSNTSVKVSTAEVYNTITSLGAVESSIMQDLIKRAEYAEHKVLRLEAALKAEERTNKTLLFVLIALMIIAVIVQRVLW